MSLLTQRARINAGLDYKGNSFSNGAVFNVVNVESLYVKVRDELLSYSEQGQDLLFSESKKDDLRFKVADIIAKEYPHLSQIDRLNLAEDIIRDIVGYGPIQPLIDEPDVSDILVNSFDNIYYEKNGRQYSSDIVFRSEKHLRNLIEKIVAAVGRRIDESTPLVDARMPDGSRINAAIPPVAVDGPMLAIRRFRFIRAEDLVAQGSVTQEQLDLLARFVRSRLNIIISGGTGTGKTTLLNILSQYIPAQERVVTIEEVTELNFQQYIGKLGKKPNLIRLEARNPNVEGRGEIDLRTLVANALRMRPDRIIVGECRRGEAFDMLQAMNTGHEGSMTTLHANTPQDALYRLENMILMAGYDLPVHVIRDYIYSAIHVIIHLTRLRDGQRVITNISEIELEGSRIHTVDLFARKDGVLVEVNEPSPKLRALLEVER